MEGMAGMQGMQGMQGTGATEATARPIVFLGPSMPLEEARQIIDADFRPPCKRGHLAEIASGAVVGLIDGVFHQDDAVSPREIVFALERGVTILGSSSMGALRAAEVPGMVGIGRVFEMYARSVIDSDDEVALLFDPDTFTPRTVPLVNVRHAVERLVRAGTIESSLGQRLLEAACALHYRDRSYRRILREAGLGQRVEADELVALLEGFDLKRDDARRLLERLPEYVRAARPGGQAQAAAPRPDYGPADRLDRVRVPDRMEADAPVLVWEIGGAVPFGELVRFLTLTGAIDRHARRAMFRFLAGGGSLSARGDRSSATTDDLKAELGAICNEEIQVTLVDLGVGFKDLLARLRDEVEGSSLLGALLRDPPEAFLKALRVELLLDDLALKREAMRCVGLARLAARDDVEVPLAERDLDVARSVVRRLQGGGG
ncbi:MAG: hypothetical protein KDK70_39245, partial [Myxococcales bacterium]|nr:hypothetical protein [Myxococcales bacterium]